MKIKEKRMVLVNGDVIYADDFLINDNKAYRVNTNIILVSPAIFELLHDHDVREIVWKQLMLVDIQQAIDHLIKEGVNLYEPH